MLRSKRLRLRVETVDAKIMKKVQSLKELSEEVSQIIGGLRSAVQKQRDQQK